MATARVAPSRSAEGGRPLPEREVIFRPPTNFVLASPKWSERSEVSSHNSFLLDACRAPSPGEREEIYPARAAKKNLESALEAQFCAPLRSYRLQAHTLYDKFNNRI